MQLLDTFEKVVVATFHPESKLDLLTTCKDVLNTIKQEIEADKYDELQIIEYVIDQRLENIKLTQIISDVLSEHPEIKDKIEETLKYTYEDLLEIHQSLQVFLANKKTDQIVSEMLSKLSELQLETFPSVSKKIDTYKAVIEQAFNKFNEVELQKFEENEFLIDESVDIQPLIKDEEHIACYCGLRSLDEAIDGFQSGRIYIFSSGTGQGKSTWLTNFAYYIAHNYKSSDYKKLFEKEYSQYKPLIIFLTNENSIDETRIRLLSIMEDKPVEYVKTLSKEKQAQFLLNFQKVTGVSLLIKYVQPRAYTAMDILSLATRYERKGFKSIAIIVDYLDRLNSTQRTKEERHLLGFITDELKYVGIKLKVPIITASQLNREGHKSETKDITHMSESWQKVQNADAIILFSKLECGDHTEFILNIGKLRYKAFQSDKGLRFMMENSLKIREINNDNSNSFMREQTLNNVAIIGGNDTWTTGYF